MNERPIAACISAMICVYSASFVRSDYCTDLVWIRINRVEFAEGLQESDAKPDRTTPANTFALLYKGVKSCQYKMVIESFSEQQKRFFLFETIFQAGLRSGDKERTLDSIFQQFEIDIDAIGNSATNVNDFFKQINDRLGENRDSFVIEINEALRRDQEPDIGPNVLSVSIDGDRALVRYTHYVFSKIRESADEEWVEKRTPYDADLHMRNYGGNWLICPEEEYKNPDFVWTPPNQ